MDFPSRLPESKTSPPHRHFFRHIGPQARSFPVELLIWCLLDPRLAGTTRPPLCSCSGHPDRIRRFDRERSALPFLLARLRAERDVRPPRCFFLPHGRFRTALRGHTAQTHSRCALLSLANLSLLPSFRRRPDRPRKAYREPPRPQGCVP